MSFIFSLFKGKKQEDDETILSNLARDIQSRQIRLSEIRTRERRATLSATLYTLSAWVVYVAAWYTGLMGRREGLRKALGALPVVIGPIVILLLRRIVQVWFESKGNAEEKTVKGLLKQQRTKVEEIKKKTNYYNTRELLQRYDDGNPQTPPRKQQPNIPVQQNTSSPHPQSHGQVSPLQAPPPPTPSVGPVRVRKTWFDRVADAVLGDAENEQPTYALICEKCFAHNGLVKESVWEETQYVCPKCKHLNLSRKAKQQGQSVKTPLKFIPSPAPKQPMRSQLSESASPTSPVSPANEQPPAKAEAMEVDS